MSGAVFLVLCAVFLFSGPAGAEPGGDFLLEEGVAPPGANDPSCRPDAEHPPVVLVHGTFANMHANFLRLSSWLAGKGYCVYALNYGDHVGPAHALGDIRESARELGWFVERVLDYTGARRVSIVGHSQGGMMPRYYIKYLGGAGKVEDLVGLAPSNHGTRVPERLVDGSPLVLDAELLGLCTSCGQQQVGSDFLRELNAGDETPGDVDYTVVATRTDAVVVPYTSSFLSGPRGRVTNVLLQDRHPYDFSGHVGIAYDPNAYEVVLDALKREGPARP
ncbi:esterase/lipase family protein [Rubrobacter xylanophilus]|uniref:esterase/lipase family protein n=1 Tax=Rubrobacter xylanophilus TaxID=49319 RepID=UPI001C63C472|nr:alpha/beta fold hydrolase [Rubrobacter xylanophilus]